MTNISKTGYISINFLFMIDHIKLKNNLNLLLMPKVGSKSCLIGFVAPTGLIQEEQSFPNAINYLLERLYWSGTQKYPNRRQLTTYLESLAARVHSYVGFETVQVFLEVPAYNQYKALYLLADIIQESLLETNEIETQKRVVKEQVFGSQRVDSIGELGKNLITQNFYLNTNYIDNNFSKLEEFMSIKRDDLLNYISHQFHPDKSYLIISGSFEDDILETCEQEWGSWTPKNKRYIDHLEQRIPLNLDMPIINYRQRGSLLTEAHLGFLMDVDPFVYFVNPETGDFLTPTELEEIRPLYLRQLCILMILNTVLGQGESSKLWSKSVIDEMLFNDISSEVTQLKHGVYLQIYGTLENSQFTFGMESILKVLDGLKKITISINELVRIKENLKGRLVLGHEALVDFTLSKIDTYINTSFEFSTEELLEVISSIQASEIRNMALDLFRPEKLTIFVHGTAKETKIINKLIDRYLV